MTIPKLANNDNDQPVTAEEWNDFLESNKALTTEEMVGLMSQKCHTAYIEFGLICAYLDPIEVHFALALLLGHLFFDAGMKGPHVSLDQRLKLFEVHTRTSFEKAKETSKAHELYSKKGEVM